MFPRRVARQFGIWGGAMCALAFLLSRSALSQTKPGYAATLSDFRPRKEVPGEGFIGSGACASVTHKKVARICRPLWDMRYRGLQKALCCGVILG